jgi:hypothetical protein
MSALTCGWCGQRARGYARINRVRYCHDDSAKPSCYEQASRAWAATLNPTPWWRRWLSL